MQSADTTKQKLLRAFLQFNRSGWRKGTIEGYKSSEIMVLMCIQRGVDPDSAGLKVSEISQRLHVTSPTVTQLIKSLENGGLIERNPDPDDRRAVCIKLTDKGEQVTRKAREAFSASFDGLVEYLGEEQSEQLAELLFKAYDYFRERKENRGFSEKAGM